MKLDNKTIVLTGGSSGVGLAILRQTAVRNIIVNLSRTNPADEGVPPGLTFTHIPTDLSDAASVVAAIEQIKVQFPAGIDGLINCAAVQYTPRFTDADFDPATIAKEIAINLTSPIALIAALLFSLSRRPDSFIMNVNSGLGLVPKRASAVYCATKAGLDNFSRGLRAQLSGSGIDVFQAFLPLVDTRMTEGRGQGKISADQAARQIISGIERGIADHDIGKVKLLRAINRVAPGMANRIMQKNMP